MSPERGQFEPLPNPIAKPIPHPARYPWPWTLVDYTENSWRYHLLHPPDSPLPRLARDPNRDPASLYCSVDLGGFLWPWYRILRDFVGCSDVVLVGIFQSLWVIGWRRCHRSVTCLAVALVRRTVVFATVIAGLPYCDPASRLVLGADRRSDLSSDSIPTICDGPPCCGSCEASRATYGLQDASCRVHSCESIVNPTIERNKEHGLLGKRASL